MWNGHNSLYAAVGCVWVHVRHVFWFSSFIHIRTFVLSLWNGLASPAPSPSEKLFLVWEPAQGAAPLSSHSVGIADSHLQMKHSALMFPFSSATSKAAELLPMPWQCWWKGQGIVSSILGLVFCLSTHPALKDAGQEWGSRGITLGGDKGRRSGSGLKQQEENPSHGHWRNG